MFKTIAAVLALSTAVVAPAAYADEAESSDITITGNVSLTSQYRLRGISQTDEDIALQGGITIAHSSGFYVGTWASNLAGQGSFGGDNLELDLIAGYTKAVGGVTLDGGVIYYVYPGTGGDFNYIDIYGAVSLPLGPVNTKVSAYYAPKDKSIGDKDNLWVSGDFAFPIKETPITLKAHVGYTSGGSALAGPSGHYLDYAAGADLAFKNLTLNVSYIDTNIKKTGANAFYAIGGHDIVDGAVVATLTAAF
ncbi:MAG: hypothetical protein IT550_01545 [Novosphingobium sp.]|nr:hypothetical protein [Novosphingobium sp.]